jgi:PAS domain S-box-containing protein
MLISMNKKNLDYKEYVKQRLQPISDLLADIAAGDFTKTLEIPEKEDEFTELYVGLTFMMEDLQEHLKEREEVELELKKHQEKLEDLVRERTDELVKINEKLEKEVIERKKIEDDLRDSEELYKSLVKTLPDAITTTDLKGTITFVSPRTVELHRAKSINELLGRQALEMIDSSDHQRAIENMKKTYRLGVIRNIEYKMLRKDGSSFIGELSAAAISDEVGKPKGFIASVRDISERKKIEEQLKISLHEKETHLRDIHHRVKNNIQVITSMLNLYANYISDDSYIEMFREIQNRIHSMALIHEKLYLATDTGRIDFYEYLSEIVNILVHFYKFGKGNVRTNIEVKNVSLPLDTAIPCGLIINELVSNSLKHAFPNEEEGEIQIILSSEKLPNDKDQITICVKDNGIGFPKDIDFKNPNSFGLLLINTFVEQLDGVLELDLDEGTEFCITFIKNK